MPMQIVNLPGLAQPTPTASPLPAPLAGPVGATAPIEPAKRVTANRESGRGDLVPQQEQRTRPAGASRGRLIDLFV
jgi:hypothetical protein